MRISISVLAVAACLAAAPATAAVSVIASNIDLSKGAYTFGQTATDTFTLSFNPAGGNNPVSVQTTGTAAVPLIFGQPAVTFTDPGRTATFGPNYFPGFGSLPNATAAPFSITSSDLGLRYSIGSDEYFGYARFAGANLISVAFETQANTAITGGAVAAAVPEPATWAMLLVGFGAVGGAMRRRSIAMPSFI